MLSIIIPARNEEKYLPLLLESIKKQKFNDLEIILADNHSEDRTRDIAKDNGCKIIDGGYLAYARNQGTKYSKGNLLLFIDADIILPENFLLEAMDEFNHRNLDIAGTLQIPIPTEKILKDLQYKIFYGIANKTMLRMQNTKRPLMQVCMFIKKAVHYELNGFDETLTWAEDSEFAKRAVENGRNFGILQSPPKVYISPRRFEDEGSMKLALKFAYLNTARLLGHEFRKGSRIIYDKNLYP